MTEGLAALLLLAFGLGLLHAFDADHIMAVSGLSARQGRARAALGFCLRWALGHGMTLLGIGGSVLLAGLHLPPLFSQSAEALVALVLIGLGLAVLRDLWRQSLHLSRHHHPGMPAHTHWRVAGEPAHDHRALLVGMLHGAAGSAPLLALLPIGHHGGAAVGMLYLTIFSLAVLLAMLAFGGLLGGLFARLQRRAAAWLNPLRGLVALGALGAGGHLLYGLA